MPEERSPLQRIVKGTLHTLGSTYFGRIVNWIAVIILTRHLTDSDIGQVSLALSLLAIIVSLRNLGLHFALIHQHDRVHQIAPTHFFLSLGLGAVGTIAAVSLALYAQHSPTGIPDPFDSQPRQPLDAGSMVPTALMVFAVFDLIRAASFTAETQLRRDLEFGRLAASHATATTIAAVVGICAVYMGAGIWSLILSHTVASAVYVSVYCTMLWMKRPPPLHRIEDFNRDDARTLLNYGRWFWVGWVLETLVLNYDRIVVGFLLKTGRLGHYDRAHIFAQMPTGAITHTIASVTGTLYARYQNSREDLSAAFRRALRFILRSTLPISLLLAVEAPAIVLLLLGEDWLPIVQILRGLLLYSLCRPIQDDINALLRSVGDPKRIIRYYGTQAAVLLFATPFLALRFGVEGAALSMSVAASVAIIVALRSCSAHVDVPWLKTLGPPVLAGGTALSIRILILPLTEVHSPIVGTIAGGCTLLLTYGIVLLLLERRTLINEMKTLYTAIRTGGEFTG
jgi:O-antigen/teichoic acid export membrane protein